MMVPKIWTSVNLGFAARSRAFFFSHVSHLIKMQNEGITYQKVDKYTRHSKVNDRYSRIQHEPVIYELRLHAGGTLAGCIRLSGRLLSKHLQTGQRFRLRTRSQRGFHGDNTPGPGEGHANQQGQRPQDEDEEDSRRGIDEEHQTVTSDRSINLRQDKIHKLTIRKKWQCRWFAKWDG